RAGRRGDGGATRAGAVGQAGRGPAALEGPFGRVGGSGPAHHLDRATEAIAMIVRNGAARRGVFLIELLVVISGLAVLMGLCAITIQLLMRVSSEAQAQRSNAAALGRLAEQFREDVHGCDEAQPRPSAGLRLTRGPRVVIDYQARDGRVDRVESV